MDTPTDVTGLEIYANEWSHPHRCGTHHRALQKSLTEWFLSFRTFDNEGAALFIASDFPLLTSLAWPDADLSRARDICALVAALVTRDDETDDERRGDRVKTVEAELQSLRNGFTGTRTKWEPLYRSIWERFATRMPARQLDRLTACVERFVEGCLRWELRQPDPDRPVSVREYSRNRHLTVGQPVSLVLVEYSLGLELDDDILQAPAVQQMQAAHVDYVWLMQDLLSYRKEVATASASNIVTVLTEAHDGDVQAAIDETHRILRMRIRDFETACADLARSPIGKHPHLHRYVEGLRDFTSGWVEWTNRSPRYDPAQYAARS
jgi:hypothetical protein